MKKILFVVIAFFLLGQTAFSQEESQKENSTESKEVENSDEELAEEEDENALNLDFGKVRPIDFELECFDKSDEFDAIYILNREFIVFAEFLNIVQRRIIHRRIRIENEEGLEKATQYISLYQEGNRKETLGEITGATYTLEEGTVQKKDLKIDAIFVEDANEYYKVVSFTMPDVQVGSIIEFTYSVSSETVLIDDLNLQYDIPVLNSDVSIQFPSRAVYNIVFNPKAKYKLDFNASDFGDRISSLKIKAEDDDDFAVDIETQQLRIGGRNIGFATENIPALKPEPLSGGTNRYRAKIMMNLAGIKDRDGKMVREYATNWEDVVKTIYNDDDFGKAIKRAGFYKSDLTAAIEGLTTPSEKVNAIFNLVKSKVKWNGKRGFYSTDGLKSAYKEGSGRVGDVNLLLVSMLQKAELEAYPVLVSSIDNDIPIFPTAQGFNYVIAQVVIDGKKMLLDATEEYARPGLIPLRAANWKGRLIKKDGSSEWVKLTDDQDSEEIVLLDVAFDEDGLVKGTVKKRLSNYMALSSRNTNADATDDELEEYLQNDNVGLVVENVQVKDLKSDDLHLSYEYDITYKNGIDKIGDKFYITPLLYDSNEENPFKLEERELPLDLSFPIETKTIVNMTIPDGYELESLPESVLLVYGEDDGYYKYITKVSGNRINTIATFKMNQSVIMPEYYNAFKEFFESIVVKDAEKIVLKKI